MYIRIKKYGGKDLGGYDKFNIYLCDKYKTEEGKWKSKEKYVCCATEHDMIFDLKISFKTNVRRSCKNKGINNTKDVVYKMIWDKLEPVWKDYREEKLRQEQQEREQRKREQEQWEKYKKQSYERSKWDDSYSGYSNFGGTSGTSISGLDSTTKETIKEIFKTGFKKLAIQNHPDRGGDEEKMKSLNSAKEKFDKLFH